MDRSGAVPASVAVDSVRSAYVHIPFCRRRCFYCDFPVSIVGDRPPLSRQSGSTQHYKTIDEYLEYLLREIQATPSAGDPLQTVFLGGGTPSLLTASQVERILDALQHQFGLVDTAEISIEMDPGTFDQSRINGYRIAGVNRVSLGVQAFQQHILMACGRTHTPADIEMAIAMLHQADMQNISLDLISGLPHQTLDDWHDSLARAIALQPRHLSIYDLTVEPMTAFNRWYQPGMAPLPSDQATATMYRVAQQTLTQAGYQHYEISNYAKPEYQCQHNRTYWTNSPYYGFGMGAASYSREQRFSRPRTRRDYYDWVQLFVESSGQIEWPPTPLSEKLLDTLMLGLRLSDGLSIGQLVNEFGQPQVESLLHCVTPHIQRQWVIVTDSNGRSLSDLHRSEFQLHDVHVRSTPARIRLSDPEGFLFSNDILSDLFQALTSPNS